jgi:hypothetical protein
MKYSGQKDGGGHEPDAFVDVAGLGEEHLQAVSSASAGSFSIGTDKLILFERGRDINRILNHFFHRSHFIIPAFPAASAASF